jgi:hypothetical protein
MLNTEVRTRGVDVAHNMTMHTQYKGALSIIDITTKEL